MVDEELISVELWFALTPLDTDWLPLPKFTPGLMFAPALMSVLLMLTLASTPTLGFTLTPVCANAGNAPITAAAAALSNRFLRLMHGLLSGWVAFEKPQVLCRNHAGNIPTKRNGPCGPFP